jgi:polyisoprenoid-binding protein YceI
MFYSYTPIEEIEAHNRQVVSILDAATGDLQFNLLVKSFEFKVALMQEHFNENYMESDKFPKSSFKGKITNLDKIDFKKDGIYPAEVSGDLTIHGVTKTVSATGTMEIKAKTINAKAEFTVSPKDYNIEIPALVENHIAKSIDINVDVTYTSNP